MLNYIFCRAGTIAYVIYYLCDTYVGAYSNNTVIIETKHVVKWVWSLYLAICMPEIFCFIRCMHRVCFRSVKKPSPGQFFFVSIVCIVS